MLLAEVSNDLAFFIGVLSSAGGAAVVWVAKFLMDWRQQRRSEDKEDEKTIVDHQTDLINRMDNEIQDLKRRMDNVGVRLTQAIAHMMYLEGLLESKGIKFRPFPRDALTGLSGSSEYEVPPEDAPHREVR